MHRRTRSKRGTAVLTHNPLESEQLLLDAMFGEQQQERPKVKRPQPRSAPRPPQAVKRPPAPKPDHYKVISISMYVEDIQRLESMVRELKRRGHFKANKSQLIRHALAQLDLDRVPRDG